MKPNPVYKELLKLSRQRQRHHETIAALLEDLQRIADQENILFEALEEK